MPDTHDIHENPDFEVRMKSLTTEAQQLRGDRADPKSPQHFLEMLRPIVIGIESLGRAMTENTIALERLESAAALQRALPSLMGAIQENLMQKNCVNQELFDALHGELRSYKDGFLLEVFHRPIVVDLITLFDDLSALHRQTAACVEDPQSGPAATAVQLRNFNTNLDHILHSLLEILARMEVQRLEASTGKLDKQKQRAVSVELADCKEDDQLISVSVKPGFRWRERLMRPEEVVIKKWKEGSLIALPSQK